MYRAWTYVWISLLGAAVCGFAAFLVIVALAALLWMPYWRQLREWNMYTHDIELTYMVVFDPPIIGFMFLLTTVASLLAMRFMKPDSRKIAVYALNAIPAALVFALLNPDFVTGRSFWWHYPLAETAVFGIGLFWAFLLQKLAARVTDNG